MASLKPLKQAFTSEDLHALDLALIGALAITKELEVKFRGLNGALRRNLFVIASQGVSDPKALQNAVVKRMNLDRVAS